MQYNQFGNSGLIVSRLSLGTMTFGKYKSHGLISNVGQDVADKMVAIALEQGINLFDTANTYGDGQSETLLGKALEKRRGDVLIATKCFFRTGPAVVHGGLSRRHIIDACEQSLRRLGTDYIDIYLLDNFDFITPLEETARALDDLQRSGKVRYVGESDFYGWQAQKLIGIQKTFGFAPIMATQVYYSLLGREIEHEILPQAMDAGLGVMIWGPLAGGFLTGKYRKGEVSEGRRKTFDFPPVDVEKGYEVVTCLDDIAAKYEATPSEVALGWILAKPWVSTMIVGASKTGQLVENLKSEKLVLQPEDVERLDSLTQPVQPFPGWVQVGEAGAADAIANGWKPPRNLS